jgi:hypothetical protein
MLKEANRAEYQAASEPGKIRPEMQKAPCVAGRILECLTRYSMVSRYVHLVGAKQMIDVCFHGQQLLHLIAGLGVIDDLCFQNGDFGLLPPA